MNYPLNDSFPRTAIHEDFVSETISDSELVELYVRGKSDQAFAALYHRHASLVASVIRRTLSDPEAGKDAFQLTFILLHMTAHKIRNPNSLSAWLHSVAYRTAKGIRQRIKRERRVAMSLSNLQTEDSSLAIAGSTQNLLRGLSVEIQLAALEEEVDRLPANQRIPVLLHYMQGDSVPVVADKLELSVTAVEGRLKRARKELRTRLAMRGMSLTLALTSMGATGSIAGASFPLDAVGGFDWMLPSDKPLSSQLRNNQLITKYHNLIQGIQEGLTMKSSLSIGGTCVAALATLLMVGYTWVLAANANQLTASPNALLTSSLPIQENGFDVTVAKDEIPRVSVQQNQADEGNPWDQANRSKTQLANPAPKPLVATQAINETQSAAEKQYRSAAEKQIHDSLFQKRDVNFNAQPLSAVMKYFSNEYNIPILINEKALEEVSISPDEPISIVMPPIQFRSCLELILRPLGLTYNIENEVLVVTSSDTYHLGAQVYNVDGLLSQKSSASQSEIVKVLEKHVRPTAWMENGGTAVASFFGDLLIVRTTTAHHLEIEDFLVGLRYAMKANDAKKQSSK